MKSVIMILFYGYIVSEFLTQFSPTYQSISLIKL